MIFRKFLIFTLVLLMCAGALAGCGGDAISVESVQKNPTEALKNSFDLKSVLGFELPQAKNEGTSRVTFGIDFSQIPELMNENLSYMNFEIVADYSGSVMDCKADIGMAEQALDASIYLDQDKLILSSDKLLGGAYAIEFEEDFVAFVDKLDRSALAKALMLPEGTIKQALEESGINGEYISGIKAAYDEYLAYCVEIGNFEAYINNIYALYESYYGDITEETIELADGKTASCVVINYTCDTALFRSFFELFMEIAEESAAAQNKLAYAIIPESARMGMNYEEMFGETDGINADMLEDMFDDVEINGNGKVYLDKKTGSFIKEDIAITFAQSGESVNIQCTTSLADGMNIAGSVHGDDGEAIGEFDVALSFDNTDGVMAWTLDINATAEESDPFSGSAVLTADTNTGKFDLKIIDGIETLMRLNGTFNLKDKAFSAIIESISAEGETLPLNITYGFESDVEITAPAEYKNLLTMTEDDVYILMGHINNAAQLFTFAETAHEELYYSNDYE